MVANWVVLMENLKVEMMAARKAVVKVDRLVVQKAVWKVVLTVAMKVLLMVD